jgi:hypothetical protein
MIRLLAFLEKDEWRKYSKVLLITLPSRISIELEKMAYGYFMQPQIDILCRDMKIWLRLDRNYRFTDIRTEKYGEFLPGKHDRHFLRTELLNSRLQKFENDILVERLSQ